MRAIIVLLATMFFLSSCATVQGIGKDIESVGKAGEEVIDGD